MPKSTGGNFLLEKGEKLGLGLGAVVGVLLIALGVMSLTGGSQDPAAFAKSLEDKAGQLKSKMDSKNPKDSEIPPLEGPIDKPIENKPVELVSNIKAPLFDPTEPPDGRRITPIVLTMAEGQADMAVVKILSNDFVLERDSEGNVIKVRVGLITPKEDSEKVDATKFLDDVQRKLKRKMPSRRRNPSGGNPGGPGFPGGPGGPPPGGIMGGGPGFPGGGMMGGGPGIPGGPPPSPGGGMMGGPGGPPPSPGGGGNFKGGFGGGGDNMYGGAQTAGRRNEIQYIEGENDEQIEQKMKGRRLAITIRPQRMVVLQGSFPYRAELAKYQAALRYAKLDDLYHHPEDMPIFNGVDVQRRLYRPKHIGSSELVLVEDWTSIDLAANSQDLRAVKLYYNDEPEDLKRVMLHEDNMLVMPLPHEIAGKYPEMKLKTLKDSIEKMKKQDAKGPSVPPPPSRFKGEGNPFKRDQGPDTKLYNPAGENGLFSGMDKRRKDKDNGNTGTPGSIEPPDNIYVRVYDTDVRDGLVHEYRMRVKLKNPNFGKADLVSKKSDADNEELPPLDEHWYTFPQKVSVPKGGYLYVVDPTKPDAKAAYAMHQPRDGQAVIQFQRWYEYLDINEHLREPIGDWVICDLLATRGMYLRDSYSKSPNSGKAFCPLPFWSSVENAFVLREIPGEKTPRGKEPRKGAILEPVRAKSLLAVEIEGGKVRARIQPNPGQATNRMPSTEDNATTEVLLMYADGTLDLRSSARDMANADRKEREEKFRKWVKETEEKNPSSVAPKKKDDF